MTHLCYTQARVHTPYDYIFYRFLYKLAWIAKFSLCSPSALLHLPSYIFPLTSSLLHLPSYIFRPQPSDIRHQPSASHSLEVAASRFLVIYADTITFVSMTALIISDQPFLYVPVEFLR